MTEPAVPIQDVTPKKERLSITKFEQKYEDRQLALMDLKNQQTDIINKAMAEIDRISDEHNFCQRVIDDINSLETE